MSYGLDFSEVRYETDHYGNRLSVIIPFKMFSALTEFWTAARRAQTASIEASARPGMFRGSLQVAQIPDGSSSAGPAAGATAVPHVGGDRYAGRHGRTWNALLAALPLEAAPEQPHEVTAEPAPPETRARGSTGGRTKQVIFLREFVQTPPDEVMQQVREGVYFLKAWRTWCRLTADDVAELLGRTPDAVNWHEHCYSRPTPKTLAKFAQIFDCPVEQLTARPGSDTQPWPGVVDAATTVAKNEPRAPDDTDYPDTVLAHLIAGKTPLTAWRLYRGMTITQLADAYGCRPDNARQLERSDYLRQRTIDRLCPILHCRAPQLLRPQSLPMRGNGRDAPAAGSSV